MAKRKRPPKRTFATIQIGAGWDPRISLWRGAVRVILPDEPETSYQELFSEDGYETKEEALDAARIQSRELSDTITLKARARGMQLLTEVKGGG